MTSILKKAVDGLSNKELSVAITHTREMLQIKGCKRTTDLHRALFLLVARQLKQQTLKKRRR